jgi:hypothetical protein
MKIKFYTSYLRETLLELALARQLYRESTLLLPYSVYFILSAHLRKTN